MKLPHHEFTRAPARLAFRRLAGRIGTGAIAAVILAAAGNSAVSGQDDSSTPPAPHGHGIEPQDVPRFVRGKQAVNDTLAQINGWVATGRGEIPDLLDAHARAWELAEEDPDSQTPSMCRNAAAMLDPDPARFRARVAEILGWPRALDRSRQDHDRPVVALGSLWTGLMGMGREAHALEVAEAMLQAFPGSRWVRKLHAHTLVLCGRHADAAPLYAALLDQDVVEGEYGVTYRHSYKGDAIDDASPVAHPVALTSPMPYATTYDLGRGRNDAAEITTVIVLDLPELELLVSEAGANPAIAAPILRAAEGKKENGWVWLSSRIRHEAALATGDIAAARASLDALLAVEKATGPADGDAGPILRWLQFRTHMAAGERVEATGLLAAILRDSVGSGGLRMNSNVSLPTLSVNAAADHAALLVGNLVASVPPEAMDAEFDPIVAVVRDSRMTLVDVWDVAFPIIRARHPERLDAARAAMGRAQAARNVKATEHRRYIGWQNGFGGMLPHALTTEELQAMMRDAAWSWILMAGPLDINIVEVGAGLRFDTASNTIRMAGNLSRMPWTGTELADQTPREAIGELARQLVALSGDGGLEIAKAKAEELESAHSSVEQARNPTGNRQPDQVWACRNYSIHREMLRALIAANPELVVTADIDLAALAKRENVPHFDDLAVMLAQTDSASAAAFAERLAGRLNLPEAGGEWPEGRTLVPMETLACCAMLGVMDALPPNADDAEAKAAATAMAGRFSLALRHSSEVGVGILNVLTREFGKAAHYEAFMARLCRNELEKAATRHFYRNTDARVSSQNLASVVSLLRDVDSNEHRGWPAKFWRWVPAEDPVWQRIELRVRQSLPLPMRSIEEDNHGLNSLAWSLHLVGRSSPETLRAVKLDIPLTSAGSASFPAQPSTVSSPMDTLAWTLAGRGEFAEAIRLETLASRLSFGNAIFDKGLHNLRKAAAAAAKPPESPAAPGGTPPETPAPGGG